MKGHIQVYRNLNKTSKDGHAVYSVRNDKWLVEDHVSKISLLNPVFRVSQKGNKRVRKEKRKNVHAYIQGKRMKGKSSLTDYNKEAILSDWWKVSYNPYKHKHFVLSDDDAIRFKSAYLVEISTDGVWAFRTSFEKI